MSEATFRKLVRNIERTGLYEPIVVRRHPEKEGNSATADKFQIINGHHRVKALEQLGHKEADCVIWDVDDEQTAILLTTLNRLAGSDIPAKKIELLKKLTQRMATAQLAKLLPQTAKQIERLVNLKLNSVPVKVNAENFAVPVVFFVTAEQKDIVERAIEKLDSCFPSTSSPDNNFRGQAGQVRRNDPGSPGSKAQRRAVAITAIAEHYLTSQNAVLNAPNAENSHLQNKVSLV